MSAANGRLDTNFTTVGGTYARHFRSVLWHAAEIWSMSLWSQRGHTRNSFTSLILYQSDNDHICPPHIRTRLRATREETMG